MLCKNKLYSLKVYLVFLGPAFLFLPPEPEVSMSVGISPALLHCCPFISKVEDLINFLSLSMLSILVLCPGSFVSCLIATSVPAPLVYLDSFLPAY